MKKNLTLTDYEISLLGNLIACEYYGHLRTNLIGLLNNSNDDSEISKCLARIDDFNILYWKLLGDLLF